MKHFFSFLLVLPLFTFAWYEHNTKVERGTPKFSKEVYGISLKIETEKVEFEQGEPLKVRLSIKNTAARNTLMPPKAKQDPKREYGLYLVLTPEKGEQSYFSRNLLEMTNDNLIAKHHIPPQGECELMTVKFDELAVVLVKEFLDGKPFVEEKAKYVPTSKLVPNVYYMKALLFSNVPGGKPDFIAGTESWRFLLKAEDPTKLPPEERMARMKKYLGKMAEGAYGGIGVSSQLAAFGDEAVDPLIVMANMKDDPKKPAVRESRIWAIVTLCGTRSKRAEDYILERIHDPVGFGDLAFLAWHSQGFRSKRVTTELRRLAEDIANGREMPWEKKYGRETRGHGMGCLEFICKHFFSIKQSVTDATVAGAVKNLSSPDKLGFVLMAWTPQEPEKTAEILKPLLLRKNVFTTPIRPVLSTLDKHLKGQGFPKYNRLAKPAELDATWLGAGLWYIRNNEFSKEERVDFLRNFVLAVRKDNDPIKKALILTLRRYAREDKYPVTGKGDFTDNWVKTWRWALQTGGYDKKYATAFLCQQMRVHGELPDVVKEGLLCELKQVIGAKFPLKSPTDIHLENDWPECGEWLIRNGYFKNR